MIICDTHCDTLNMRVFHKDEAPCVTMDNLVKGGVSLQTCALFAGSKGMSDHPYERAIAQYNELCRLGREEGWEKVNSPLDAEEGKVKILLSVEGGEIFEGNPDRVTEFYGYGVRMAGVTWNNENEMGHPAKHGSREGIKPRGWDVLRRMAELKIGVDTSHLNEAGFWDLIDKHSQPPLASHSCAKKLRPHFRNLTDEQIRAMVERGGWSGVNFYPWFLGNSEHAVAEDIVTHIDYMCQLGAHKHVGFGSDFDGIEVWPEDCDSPAGIPLVIDGLRRRGYSEEAIADIAGRNFLDYYKRLGW
ncbi:MAG: membrane dipeptidase [Clostridia bacterium]|nr:membrane dipeptidase [Clostridia bacterium]